MLYCKLISEIKKAQWVKLGFSIFHFLRRSKLNLRMGSPIDPIPNYFPPANILMISCLSEDPLYKNKFFLHQKYVEERLSCEEISSQIFSARTTVLKYPKLHNIPIRDVGSNIKRVRGLAYGQKVKERTITEHKREQATILKIRELRDKGFSY